MRPLTILATASLAMLLAACGQPGSDAASAAGEPASAPADAPVAARAPADVIEAVKCWGLVQGAYTYHMAMPEQAAGLPMATEAQKTAWFHEALRRAGRAGLDQAAFGALQDEYQMSNRFAVASAREAAVQPLTACIAATPADPGEPPQLPEG
ncbi:MAG: hypothetical protein GC145_17040 [Caulobacter sp.]|nr:hypothetical protein [Caulobacter sp.]